MPRPDHDGVTCVVVVFIYRNKHSSGFTVHVLSTMNGAARLTQWPRFTFKPVRNCQRRATLDMLLVEMGISRIAPSEV